MKKNHLTRKQQQQRSTASRIERASSPDEISQIIDVSANNFSPDNYRLKIVYLEGMFGNFEKFYDVLGYSKEDPEHNKIIFQLICYSIIR